jgi:iron complex outermembrane receptor protein
MRNVIFILLLAYLPFLQAQNSIHGNINDVNDGPIFGVQIYIELLHLGTTSDENGYFELNNIPNGDHSVVFHYIGFKTENVEIHLADNDTEINLQLEESVFLMDEVIVSTPFHKIQSENVIKVDYRSIKNLEKNGAPTLIQGIVAIPGVEQISAGTGIGKPVIRGLSGNRVLIYTQGVRLENQQFGSEHGLGLNEAGIESVEVIKGPASLLYGSDALGGVLYFNPERFALKKETIINVNQKFFANTLGSNTSFGVKTSTNVFKFLFRGTYNTHIDYKIPNGDRVTNTRFDEKDFKIGMGYSSKKYVTELRYNFINSAIGIPEGIGIQTNSRTPNLPYQDISTQILSLHNHLFFNNSTLDFNFGYVFNNRKEFEEHDHHEGPDNFEELKNEEEEHAALHMKLNTFTYDVKYNFPKYKNFESILGIQGLNQDNKNFGEEILIPNAKTNDFGIFASGLFTWKESNSFQIGLRFDYRNINTEEHIIIHEDEVHIFEDIDKSYNNFTGSVGYKTQLVKPLALRVNLASGFRAPNLAELTSFGVHHGSNRFEIGNPDLKSEQNIQIDVSLEYQSEHLEFYANGFYNNILDYIFISPTGEFEDGYEIFKYIQHTAFLYGGELGLHFHPHPIHWLHFESNFESVTGKQKSGEYLPLIPTNKFSNTLRGEFRGNDKINEMFISLQYQNYLKKTNVNTFETPTEAYNLLNFSFGGNLSFKKSDLHINFSVNNLLNKEYISHLSILKVDGIPNIGRNIVLGLNFKI